MMCFSGCLTHSQALGQVTLTVEGSSGPQAPAQRPLGHASDGSERSRSAQATGRSGVTAKKKVPSLLQPRGPCVLPTVAM